MERSDLEHISKELDRKYGTNFWFDAETGEYIG